MLESLEMFRPMRLDTNTFMVYILNPDTSDNYPLNCKFCINAKPALRSNRLKCSMRLVVNEVHHTWCVISLLKDDFIHYVYNIGSGPQHFWGQFNGNDFTRMTMSEYKEHKERFTPQDVKRLEITGDLDAFFLRNEENRKKCLMDMIHKSLTNRTGLDETLINVHDFDGNKRIKVRYDKGV